MEYLFSENLVSDETEFVHFYPRGYRPGLHKYIFITGGVMSGVGKGVFAAALAYLLKCHGYRVSLVKTEGYLNLDSGTLNPFRHGEVFVLDDGTESDLDLGNYERFLDIDLNSKNFLTSGKVYSIILQKERQGKYLGRDVLVIPHLTGEIKYLWREKALEGHCDVLLVEIGGTVGDYENLHYIEAARQMRNEEGVEQVVFCHVSPIIYSPSSNELKSKPTQHGVRTLMQFGVQPDFIVCRSEKPLSTRVKEKVSLYCNVPLERTVEAPTCDSVYGLPHFLERQEKIVEQIQRRLRLAPVQGFVPTYPLWEYEEKRRKLRGEPVRILIAGKYVHNHDAYISILQALEHASVEVGSPVEEVFFDVSLLEEARTDGEVEEFLAPYQPIHGIIVPGGFGKRGVEEKIKIARYARTTYTPFLGICLGFQLALVEIARSLAGLEGANSTEFDPQTPYPIIDLLPSQKEIRQLGGSMRLGKQKVHILQGTLAYQLYGAEVAFERFRHRYEFNIQYKHSLEEKGVVFSGHSDDKDIYQIFELENHPYFIGTQFHPEYLSRPLKPRPVFLGLVQMAKSVLYARGETSS